MNQQASFMVLNLYGIYDVGVDELEIEESGIRIAVLTHEEVVRCLVLSYIFLNRTLSIQIPSRVVLSCRLLLLVYSINYKGKFLLNYIWMFYSFKK